MRCDAMWCFGNIKLAQNSIRHHFLPLLFHAFQPTLTPCHVTPRMLLLFLFIIQIKINIVSENMPTLPCTKTPHHATNRLNANICYAVLCTMDMYFMPHMPHCNSTSWRSNQCCFTYLLYNTIECYIYMNYTLLQYGLLRFTPQYLPASINNPY